MGLSSILIIKDKKILISLPKHLELINAANNKIKELGIKFEPGILGLNYKKTDHKGSVFSCLLGDKDSNLDSQDQNLESYH